MTVRRPGAVGVVACWTAAVGVAACWIAVAASGVVAWVLPAPPWTQPTTIAVWICCPARTTVRSS